MMFFRGLTYIVTRANPIGFKNEGYAHLSTGAPDYVYHQSRGNAGVSGGKHYYCGLIQARRCYIMIIDFFPSLKYSIVV
jgi:hypothetical protein